MRTIGILGGYACLGLSFLIVFEIFARKLFNHSLQGVDEIGGYVVAIVGTFGMALAAVERAHTRIDVLLLRLPAPMQTALNLLSYVALGLGAAFMGYMVAILTGPRVFWPDSSCWKGLAPAHNRLAM